MVTRQLKYFRLKSMFFTKETLLNVHNFANYETHSATINLTITISYIICKAMA